MQWIGRVSGWTCLIIFKNPSRLLQDFHNTAWSTFSTMSTLQRMSISTTMFFLCGSDVVWFWATAVSDTYTWKFKIDCPLASWQTEQPAPKTQSKLRTAITGKSRAGRSRAGGQRTKTAIIRPQKFQQGTCCGPQIASSGPPRPSLLLKYMVVFRIEKS